MLLRLLAASILGNALTQKGVITADEEVIREVQKFKYHLIF